MIDVERALATATKAARVGGELALASLGNPGYEKRKAPGDVFAGAVMDIQAAITEAIRQEYPDDPILAEEMEGADDRQKDPADPLWIIDPLDGSLNFLHGIPIFAVSIAYRVGGLYRLGVVFDPNRNELFHAVSGRGAFLNGRPIHVDQFSDGREALDAAVVGTDWRGGMDDIRKALRLARYVAAEILQLITLGAPALGLCYVAAGRLHAYYGLDHLKLWDVAAGAVILMEAGGVFTDIDGASWLHAQGGYVASNNVIHGSLGRIIAPILRLYEPERLVTSRGQEM